jgi:hypothetical protein
MCDDSMPTLHERCRVIGADVAVDEEQDFHRKFVRLDRSFFFWQLNVCS